jgi:hypothetical protein
MPPGSVKVLTAGRERTPVRARGLRARIVVSFTLLVDWRIQVLSRARKHAKIHGAAAEAGSRYDRSRQLATPITAQFAPRLSA